MAQRIHNLTKWRFIHEGAGMMFANPNRRVVVLDVNVPGVGDFYISQAWEDLEDDPERIVDIEAGRRRPDDPVAPPPPSVGRGAFKGDEAKRAVSFIGRCEGRDRLEFAAEGAFELVVLGADAYVFTNDSQDIGTIVEAPIIFTRIANRRQRNPHLEMVEYQMKLNLERRLQAMSAEADRRVEALEKRLERYAPERIKGKAPALARAEARRKVETSDGENDGTKSENAHDRAGSGGSAKGESGAGSAVPAKRKKVTAPPVDGGT